MSGFRLFISGLFFLTLVGAANARPLANSTYKIIYLSHSTLLYSSPEGRIVAAQSPITEFGGRATLTIIKERREWFGVISTKQENNSLAWVRKSAVINQIRTSALVLRVSLSKHQVRVIKNNKEIASFVTGVGSPSSPTPTGTFSITDRLPGSRFSTSYGCCILALSAHQTHLAYGWSGGDRIALHGTNIPSSIGRNESNGCLHLSSKDMHYLMHLLPVGTKVIIAS